MPRILGIGSYLPSAVITNQMLEKIVPGVRAEWTEKTLNIRERRIVDIGETVVDMARHAVLDALRDFDVPIDALIFATTTPPQQAPSAACSLLESMPFDCPAFDLSAACAGFVYALIQAAHLVFSGTHRNVMVVASDAYSTVTDWYDRNCVFFGDGAGAIILGDDHKDDLFSFAYGASGKDWRVWQIKDGKWCMDGKEVYRLAVKGIVDGVQGALKGAGMQVGDVDIVIPHQPGIGVLRDAAKELNIPFAKVHTVMDKYANTSSASVPIALHDALLMGKISKGDVVLLTTVGAGWVWASCVLRWT